MICIIRAKTYACTTSRIAIPGGFGCGVDRICELDSEGVPGFLDWLWKIWVAIRNVFIHYKLANGIPECLRENIDRYGIISKVDNVVVDEYLSPC
jgi:hypothetical protein